MSVSFSLTDRGPITAVDAFVREVSAVREATHRHKLWFRGHSKSEFKLLPTIGRPASYGGLAKKFNEFNATTERELLHRFRRRAFPHCATQRDTDGKGFPPPISNRSVVVKVTKLFRPPNSVVRDSSDPDTHKDATAIHFDAWLARRSTLTTRCFGN